MFSQSQPLNNTNIFNKNLYTLVTVCALFAVIILSYSLYQMDYSRRIARHINLAGMQRWLSEHYVIQVYLSFGGNIQDYQETQQRMDNNLYVLLHGGTIQLSTEDLETHLDNVFLPPAPNSTLKELIIKQQRQLELLVQAANDSLQSERGSEAFRENTANMLRIYREFQDIASHTVLEYELYYYRFQSSLMLVEILTLIAFITLIIWLAYQIGRMKRELIIDHQKEAELLKQLKEKDETLKLTLKTANVGIWIWDIQNDSISWDHIMLQMFDAPPDQQFSYAEFEKRVHPDDIHMVNAAVKNALEQDEKYDIEFRVVWQDQSLHYVMARGYVTRNDINDPIKFTGICVDITKQRETEEELKRSEEQFKQIIEKAPLPVIIHAEDGEVLLINHAWTKLTGYNHEDIPTIDVWTRKAYPYNHDEIRIIIQQLYEFIEIQDDDHEEGDYIIRTKSGDDRVWFFNSSRLKPLPDGRRVVISMAIDVTERNRAVQELKLNEEKYRTLFETVPVSIWEEDWTEVFDMLVPLWEQKEINFQEYFNSHPVFVQQALQSVKIVDVNQETISMFQADSKQQLLDSLTVVFATKDTLPGFINELIALSNHQRFFNTEMKLNTIKGEEIHTLLSMSFPENPLESGKVLVSLMNITERVKIEKELELMNLNLENRVNERTAELEFINKELESFSYSVSHDLRAPLRHLSGFLDLFKNQIQNSLDEKSERYLKIIQESANHLGNLIDDLLQFSRAGRTAMTKTNVHLNHLVEEVIYELKPELKNRDIEWVIDPLPEIYADRNMMKLVMTNLISNALKFTGKNQQAKIRISSLNGQDHEHIIYVKDNGVGFDMKYAVKLFEVFQRLHSKEEFEGSGIGLANVQRIIHRHGGRCWAESEINKGATLYISIPLEGD